MTRVPLFLLAGPCCCCDDLDDAGSLQVPDRVGDRLEVHVRILWPQNIGELGFRTADLKISAFRADRVVDLQDTSLAIDEVVDGSVNKSCEDNSCPPNFFLLSKIFVLCRFNCRRR